MQRLKWPIAFLKNLNLFNRKKRINPVLIKISGDNTPQEFSG
jgi:hypothetical protein